MKRKFEKLVAALVPTFVVRHIRLQINVVERIMNLGSFRLNTNLAVGVNRETYFTILDK